jgi:hypothetical protein
MGLYKKRQLNPQIQLIQNIKNIINFQIFDNMNTYIQVDGILILISSNHCVNVHVKLLILIIFFKN